MAPEMYPNEASWPTSTTWDRIELSQINMVHTPSVFGQTVPQARGKGGYTFRPSSNHIVEPSSSTGLSSPQWSQHDASTPPKTAVSAKGLATENTRPLSLKRYGPSKPMLCTSGSTWAVKHCPAKWRACTTRCLRCITQLSGKGEPNPMHTPYGKGVAR
jgi:hypothetical protein